MSARPRLLCAALLALLPGEAARALDPELRVSVVRAGGGFLVADGVSVVPLFILVNADKEVSIQSAKVTASLGKTSETKVISADRVRFLYAPPRRPQEVPESFDVTLVFSGGERTESFALRIPTPASPAVGLVLEPDNIAVKAKESSRVDLVANANGSELEDLRVAIGPGAVAEARATPSDGGLRLVSTVDPREAPDDQPAYLLALAAASGRRGFGVKTAGLTTEAPIRLSVEIPPGSQLVVEGASNTPPPVQAPADGRTVMENVVVRYGAPFRAFSQQGGKKREVAVAVPAASAPGVVLGIPGQTVADGGTGPTILVAIPPSSFGGEPTWPEIALEGATILATQKIAPDVRALVIKRPTELGAIQVLLDEQPAGTIELTAGYGITVEASPTYVKSGERAAVEVVVRDALGEPTDSPRPRVGVMGGGEVALEREAPGKYRARILANAAGASGAELTISAEIAPAPLVAGEPLELARATAKVKLEGAGPAVGGAREETPKAPPEVSTERPRPKRREEARFGAGLAALAGTTFNGLLMVGGGVRVELRLPFWEQRLAGRLGLLFSHASGAGTIFYDGQENASRTTVAGVVVPIDVGVAVVQIDGFELLVRGGVTLRLEDGALTVASDTVAGGKRAGIGGTVSLEADIDTGSGAVQLGASLDGIGATADGFSSDGNELRGPLTNVRADVGYRLWF